MGGGGGGGRGISGAGAYIRWFTEVYLILLAQNMPGHACYIYKPTSNIG